MRAGTREPSALLEARLGPQVRRHERLGAIGAALQDRKPRRRRADRAGDRDDIAGSRAVTPDEVAVLVGPAGDGHRDRQCGRLDDVAAGDRRPGAGGEGLHRRDELDGLVAAEARGRAEDDVRLARVGAHGGEVRQRRGEGSMAGVGRRDARVVEAEVHAVDHRVDARDGERPRADHRGVVAHPPHDALGAPRQILPGWISSCDSSRQSCCPNRKRNHAPADCGVSGDASAGWPRC